jgi:hypothetical protein
MLLLVLGLKLDDKTIYAWFHEDLEPFSSRYKRHHSRRKHRTIWTYPTQGTHVKSRQKMKRVRELQQI